MNWPTNVTRNYANESEMNRGMAVMQALRYQVRGSRTLGYYAARRTVEYVRGW